MDTNMHRSYTAHSRPDIFMRERNEYDTFGVHHWHLSADDCLSSMHAPAELSHAECVKVASCKYFTWSSSKSGDRKNTCWLKTAKSVRASLDGLDLLSGPKKGCAGAIAVCACTAIISNCDCVDDTPIICARVHVQGTHMCRHPLATWPPLALMYPRECTVHQQVGPPATKAARRCSLRAAASVQRTAAMRVTASGTRTAIGAVARPALVAVRTSVSPTHG